MFKRLELELSDMISLIEEKLALGGEVKFSPRGVSMLPLIRPAKDSVTLKRKELPERFDIAFYKRKDGQFVLHRVIKRKKDGSYVMCGDNQWRLEKGISKNQIIAVVSNIEKDGENINFFGMQYRAYCGLLFLRRIYLFLKQKGLVRRAFGKIKRTLKHNSKG